MSRIFRNIPALALVVGALIGSAGASNAQNHRSYNNAYGPRAAYSGDYRSHRAMAPVPYQRGYYTNSFDKNQSCWQSPASLEYTGGCY